MAFDQTIPSSFPLLYQSEWKIEFQQMTDHVRKYMDVYHVDGERRQFKRLQKVNGRKIVERPDRASASRRRVGDDTNLGDTEIINLLTEFYQADDCEVERTEVERLGMQDSPHDQFKTLQKAWMARKMSEVAIDGILGDRRLGKNGTELDSIPAEYIIDAANGFNYEVFDDIYTDFGAKQVLGQGVDGDNTWTLFCRHKDLQKFRNDATLINRDFSDVRPIDNGKLYQFRDGYICPLPDAAFANQVGTADAGTPTDGRTRLPIFARPAVAWGETGSVYANCSQPDTWKGNALLELEQAFGCTTLDWTGVRAIEVPT